MTLLQPRARRVACLVARTAAGVSAVMLLVTAWAMTSTRLPDASAAPAAGSAFVVVPPGATGAGQHLGAGGSATDFTLALPTGAACTGDSASGGYKVQSYMVPSSVDPATLKFDASGPTPQATGTVFRQPLFDTNGSVFVNAQTANADTPGGPGLVINIPAFDFSVFAGSNAIAPGTYNVGIACTLGPASSATQLDKYWNVEMVFTADASDPAGVKWTSAAVAPATTTTSAGPTTSTTGPTSTTSSSSTSTSTSSTTSTTRPTTTTTRASTTTTSTTTATTTTTSTTSLSETGTTTTELAVLAESLSSGGGDPTSPAVLGAQLPRTGASVGSLLLWGVLLVTFGRMAVLLGRAPVVRPAPLTE